MRRLLVLLVASLAVLSCSPPPFNLELSLGARTARVLTMEGTVGPIDKNTWGGGVADAVFFAETGTTGGLDLQNGFLLATYPWGDHNLSFISWDVDKKMYLQAGMGLPFGNDSADPFPGFLIMNLKGAPHYAGMFTFSATNPGINQFTFAHADPAVDALYPAPSPTYPLYLGPAASSAFGVPTGNVIGVSRYPSPDPTQDITYWLFKTLSGESFMEGAASVSSAGLAAPVKLSTRLPLPYSLGAAAPTGLTRALYYYDPDPSRTPERSYLSWYDQGMARWRCVWWSGMTPQATELTGVDHRVDAVLTTGDLFSAEGHTGRVYGRDGSPGVSFPLDGMNFVEERFINGTARMLFAQYLFYDNTGWVNVYSIPTKDLASLVTW